MAIYHSLGCYSNLVPSDHRPHSRPRRLFRKLRSCHASILASFSQERCQCFIYFFAPHLQQSSGWEWYKPMYKWISILTNMYCEGHAPRFLNTLKNFIYSAHWSWRLAAPRNETSGGIWRTSRCFFFFFYTFFGLPYLIRNISQVQTWRAFWRKCVVMVQHNLLKIRDHIDRAAHSSILSEGNLVNHYW